MNYIYSRTFVLIISREVAGVDEKDKRLDQNCSDDGPKNDASNNDGPNAGVTPAPSTRGRRGRKRRQPSSPQGFYSQVFTEDEVNDLAAGAEKADLADEIRLLKVLIRRRLLSGQGENGEADLKAVGTTVNALCRAVKAQHAIAGTGASDFEQALGAALTEISDELGLRL